MALYAYLSRSRHGIFYFRWGRQRFRSGDLANSIDGLDLGGQLPAVGGRGSEYRRLQPKGRGEWLYDLARDRRHSRFSGSLPHLDGGDLSDRVAAEKSGFGRYLSAIGCNERATFLSGVSTPSVIFAAFAIAGVCSAMGGVLLAGYANQAYQSMGVPFLLPTIAAVVIGGTSIMGERGSLVGTIDEVLFITLLTSILSVMQISDAWRNIVFGLIIIAMLLQTLRRKGA